MTVRRSRKWTGWILACAGAISLLWFLIRVIPKPSRAAYPCQRAAFPLASSFVVWVMALFGSNFAWRNSRAPGLSCWRASLWLAAAAVGLAIVVVNLPSPQVNASLPRSHGPIGVAQGVFPGRVVWVHAPEATSWAGPASTERWWHSNHTDLAVVEEMMSRALLSVSGSGTEPDAWDAIFRHFNQTHGRGPNGYQPGEKLAIKINLTTCNARSGGSTVDPATYEKRASIMNTIDNSPQILLALLRQLVYRAGVPPQDIALGDPTGQFPQFMYDLLHGEFPEVIYFDNAGQAGSGRTRTLFSATRFDWSTPEAIGKRQDFVPVQFADAAYLINFAVLKGHGVGITVCAKNHYGSLLRCPDGYLRDAGVVDYYDMHTGTPLPSVGGTPGMGHYRANVDLMGHPALGGKTLLYLVDGLFAGYYWDSKPLKWKMPPFGDGVNADWPSSLLASLDPVAIDSVAHDFLLNEWPKVVTTGGGAPDALQGGAEDYLHEAAQADNPASGTFYDPGRTGARLASLGVHEHWNNAIAKQYSRNLGTGPGIELVYLTATAPSAQLAIHRLAGQIVVSWPGSLTNYQLQSAASLDGPVPWINVHALPALFQGRNTVINPAVGTSQFYRLAR